MSVASFMPMSFYSWGGVPFYLLHQRQGGPQNQKDAAENTKISDTTANWTPVLQLSNPQTSH